VALSASNFTDQLIEKCTNAGFNDWLGTPVEIGQLENKILDRFFG